jgi:hypothetical protein
VKRSNIGVAALLGVVTFGLVACSSSGSSSTGITGSPSGSNAATTAASGGGGGVQTFHGTADLTGTSPLSGSWTGTGTYAQCDRYVKLTGVVFQRPGGGNVGSTNLGISVAIPPSTFTGPGTYQSTDGVITVASGSGYSFSTSSPGKVTINPDGSGSLVFTGAQDTNAVSGAVTGTESGTISWTCSN